MSTGDADRLSADATREVQILSVSGADSGAIILYTRRGLICPAGGTTLKRNRTPDDRSRTWTRTVVIRGPVEVEIEGHGYTTRWEEVDSCKGGVR